MKNYILALAFIPVLASCGTTLTFKAATVGFAAAKYGIFSKTDVNLKEKNYAAADLLAVKMQDSVTPEHLILALPLEEFDHAGMSSPLGSYIPEGVGLRLAELGYQVQLHKVAGNGGLYPDPKDGAKADFVLKGSYKYSKKQMDIFLRLVDVKSSKIVSIFDYSMPLSKEVRDLSKTPTRVFRTK